MESVQVFIEEIINQFRRPSPSLPRMDLGQRDDYQNPLMVSSFLSARNSARSEYIGDFDNSYFKIQFFEWDSQGTNRVTWWQKFELEVPRLKELGFTRAWLPPPNKGMTKVRHKASLLLTQETVCILIY